MLAQSPPVLFSSDTSVQGTNDDAQVSKLSCTRAGYFRDDYLHFFVKRASRRSPLINRGYFSRYTALRCVLNGFLEATEGKEQQILVLGAGYDTAWFHLQKEGRAPTRYLEVDFKEVTMKKAAIVAQQPTLNSFFPGAQVLGSAAQPSAAQPPRLGLSLHPPQPVQSAKEPAPGSNEATTAPPAPPQSSTTSGEATCGEREGVENQGSCSSSTVIDSSAGSIVSPNFCMLPVDLTDLKALEAACLQAGFDFSLPTYILSECVLVYMDPTDSTNVINWCGERFKCASMAVYEQIKPYDAFGRQMCSNLISRGCPLRGVTSTPTLEAHMERFLSNGWAQAGSLDMDTIYRLHLDPKEKLRAERLEIFDEFEEWHMIQEHYSITYAVTKGAEGSATDGEKDAGGVDLWKCWFHQPYAPGSGAPAMPLVD